MSKLIQQVFLRMILILKEKRFPKQPVKRLPMLSTVLQQVFPSTRKKKKSILTMRLTRRGRSLLIIMGRTGVLTRGPTWCGLGIGK